MPWVECSCQETPTEQSIPMLFSTLLFLPWHQKQCTYFLLTIAIEEDANYRLQLRSNSFCAQPQELWVWLSSQKADSQWDFSFLWRVTHNHWISRPPAFPQQIGFSIFKKVYNSATFSDGSGWMCSIQSYKPVWETLHFIFCRTTCHKWMTGSWTYHQTWREREGGRGLSIMYLHWITYSMRHWI